MRRATHDTKWYLGENGELIGITLGFDFCGEHEDGVDPLMRIFGMPDKTPIGLDDRRIRQVPESLSFARFTHQPSDKRRKAYPCAALALHAQDLEAIRNGHLLTFYSEPHEEWYDSRDDLACAWSRDNFAILARGEENIPRLAELFQAFQRLDILFGSVRAVSFIDRAGLTFILDSRISDETREQVLEADLDHQRLHEAARATGIEKRLRDAGRRWYALSPAWADESKTTVRFWLNPVDQHLYSANWYTVEELERWAEGTGPVMKEVAAGGRR